MTRRGSRPSLASDLAATAAMSAYSIAVAVGFARVFAGWDFLRDLVVLTLMGHGLALVSRRARIPAWIAVPGLLVALTWLIGMMHYRFTFSFLLPTSDTWNLFRSEIELVRGQFRTAVAPVLYGAGWDVLASIGVAISVILADTFAFRAGARAEALVPGGVLFVFIAALGDDRLRIPLTLLLVATGVLATAVLRAYHDPAGTAMTGRRWGALRRLVPMAVVSASLIALLAGFVGPRIPGASAEPIFDDGGGSSGSVTTIVNPLVDIRSRLTNQKAAELFTVEANLESYWRSSSLPAFDGTTWQLPERTVEAADGELASARVGTTELRQSLRVVNLGGRLVPAAAEPVQADGPGDLRWSADTSTLLRRGEELATGDVYEIVSAAPRFDPVTLATATSVDPGDPIYLELPEDFPDDVRRTAAEVTGGATTSYDAALALQNWFRSEFAYSLEVQSGHSTNAIQAFLRERVGYCEQFAGTYAAMLRSIGIPTRVAVGYTTGTAVANGVYSVLGKNAHAWPEVWFDGLGWVPFEPTPGRGAPGAESYTDVPAQQDDGITEPAPQEESETPTPATTTPAGPPLPQDAQNPVPLDLGGEALPPTSGSTGSGNAAITVVTVLAIAALVLAFPPLVRRIRRRTHGTPERQLAQLWERALQAVDDVGVRVRPSATPMEAAALTADRFPVAARPFNELAEVVTETAYRPDGPDRLERAGPRNTTKVSECAAWCRQVERATHDEASLAVRVRRYFTRWG